MNDSPPPELCALTPDELLAACNRIRIAGGAKPLKQLLPGHSNSAHSCLIARNLNFNCSITPRWRMSKTSRRVARNWNMYSNDERLALVANALGVPLQREINRRYIVLPAELAASARAFDEGEYPEELYI